MQGRKKGPETVAWGGTAPAQPGPGEPMPESDLPAFLRGPHKRGCREVAVLKFASGTGSTRKGSPQGEHESFCSSGHFCPCPEVVDGVQLGPVPAAPGGWGLHSGPPSAFQPICQLQEAGAATLLVWSDAYCPGDKHLSPPPHRGYLWFYFFLF